MDAAPLVTTILPSYNHARYVAEAVRSAWVQDYPNHELVAIDDGSTDGSAEILRRLAAESPIPMRVVARENRGVSATLNEGIAMSEAPYINVCASDDRLAPNKLTDLVGALEAADPETGAAFGDRRYVDESGNITEGPPIRFQPTGDRVFLDLIMGRVIMPAPAMLYRRRVFDEIGGFNEHVSLEDWEFFLRLTHRFKVVLVPEIVVEYRSHPEQTQKTKRSHIAIERVSVFEGWIGKAPELDDPKALRDARARMYMLTGSEHYVSEDMAEARHWFIKSLAQDPTQRQAWSLLTRATVGKRPFAIARAIRDAVRRRG